ncbi:hypothetical protein [Haladaptatus sp. W1]|nr:hypothetical protein [Haladaptatus sp. W1]
MEDSLTSIASEEASSGRSNPHPVLLAGRDIESVARRGEPPKRTLAEVVQ